MSDYAFDFDAQASLMGELERLVAETAQAEKAALAEQERAVQDVTVKFSESRAMLSASFDQRCESLHSEYADNREAAIYAFESDAYQLVLDHDRQMAGFEDVRDDALREADRRRKAARKASEEQYAASRAAAKATFTSFRQQCEQRHQSLMQLDTQSRQLLQRRRCLTPTGSEVAGNTSVNSTGSESVTAAGHAESPLVQFEDAMQQTYELLRQWQAHGPSRFLEQRWPILIFVFAWLAAFYPVAAAFDFNLWIWPLLTTGIAVLFAFIVHSSVRPFVKRKSNELFPQIQQQIGRGLQAIEDAVRAAEAEKQRRYSEAVQQRDEALTAARRQHEQRRKEVEEAYQGNVDIRNQEFTLRNRELKQVRDRRLAEIENWLPATLNPLTAAHQDALQSLEREHAQRLEQAQTTFDQHRQTMTARWQAGLDRFQSAVRATNEFREEVFPSWESPVWHPFQPAVSEPPVLPFGTHKYTVDTRELPATRDSHFQLPKAEHSFPAALQLPDHPSLLYEAAGLGREEATRSMRNTMLRMLTAMPPGKVRFTIIDPVGLGQNFSAFMHLADFDEKLVANRIWTETSQIQKRLIDLTEHMENVIQKYLRNEFDSIHEYNRHAGEVAEPFQILVVANFPAGFNDEAARRLISIATSGARCGVYTLISVDTKMKLPRNFDLADLEQNALTLRWNGERFYLLHPGLEKLPLTLDGPPDEERFTEVVRAVGRLAKDASRVEVPFASVTAAPNEWWSRDSREGVEVALGRAGATKLQPMRLGSGTSQHVLIAGKTGSGKSTLLNALIVNLSIWYSPEELQFYLIDFKKGVEFKPYAAYSLPHARVIAVESEREFGMSVLERLDAELRERGDLFRKQGVQNLAAWRDANPDAVMPRLLLIIDEFQEFFVKDDKIASDAALLLDRLVRQGRAFGIHVLLGSQTLAGAYTLARSTLGQMAVRIALQCSESDAHLILSDDNTAARLLSRPGEAIYNDANGLFEGNHPFQVVWLSDNEREHYLERIGELSKVRAPRIEPPIVFEGNQPADPSENRHLAALLEMHERGRSTAGATGVDGDVEQQVGAKRAAAKVWLGAAVAIKEPTSISFHRQSGANVLVVGPQEELAVGLLANCVLSLALNARGNAPAMSIDHGESDGEAGSNGSSRSDAESAVEPLVTVLDGLRPESALAGSWNRFDSRMPNEVRVVSGRDAIGAVAELAAEVSRRTETHDEQAPGRFLVIANLARFRELQRGDDFSFSSFGEEEKPDPGKQFRTILREGPAVGVHTLIWADSFSSASRWLDRQTLQDLDYRVLFQMGAGDSSNLMDSSAAANLGPYRAILYRHELGEFEKFRPYAYPTHAWIGRIADVVNSEISGGASSFAAEAAVVRPSLESVD